MSGPRTLDQLPSFAQVRADAYRRLGDVEDVLRSDCRPGDQPTARQLTATRRAMRAIAQAKAHLTEAVYR